jgi:hypothetical protein
MADTLFGDVGIECKSRHEAFKKHNKDCADPVGDFSRFHPVIMSF